MAEGEINGHKATSSLRWISLNHKIVAFRNSVNLETKKEAATENQKV